MGTILRTLYIALLAFVLLLTSSDGLRVGIFSHALAAKKSKYNRSDIHPSSLSPYITSTNSLYMALCVDASTKIDQIRLQYKELKDNKRDNDKTYADKLKEMKIIVDCADALISIDNDLAMFNEHLNGNDEKLKQTAEIFSKEFIECKEQIELQLNKLLMKE